MTAQQKCQLIAGEASKKTAAGGVLTCSIISPKDSSEVPPQRLKNRPIRAMITAEASSVRLKVETAAKEPVILIGGELIGYGEHLTDVRKDYTSQKRTDSRKWIFFT